LAFAKDGSWAAQWVAQRDEHLGGSTV